MSLKRMLTLLSVFLTWCAIGWISSTFILERSGLVILIPKFYKFRFVTILIGVVLLVLSTTFFVISRFLKEEEKQVSKYIRCKVCGRKIPFDMVICPYCFSDIRERKNELSDED